MQDAVYIVTELQRRYALDWEQQAPIQDEVSRWTGRSPEAESIFYDSVAAELARGYHERRYAFEFCDAVLNQFYALMISKQLLDEPPPWPKLFWRVYEAFDAAETQDDGSNARTHAEIAVIVAGQ